MKKYLLSIIVAFGVIALMLSNVSADELSDKEVISQTDYEDYEMDWHRSDTAIFDSLDSVSKDGTLIAAYKYDENNNRVQKNVGDEVVYYKYTKDLYLDTVVDSYGCIQYIYEFKNNSNIKIMSGFIFENEEYTFIYDEYDNIIGIGQDDLEIARYIYDDSGSFKCTLCNQNGEWMECNEQGFIGNINKVRFKQAYYDNETGWYYCGRYYDASQARYLDGVDVSDKMRGKNVNLLELNNTFTIDFIPQGKTRSSYSETETICRILYCEAGTSSYDWDAVAWAVYYRISDNGKTALSELTSGDFQAYNNGDYMFDTSSWYNQNKWNICYENAQRLVGRNAPNRSVPYITNQKHFNSVNTFISHYDSDGISTQYYDVNVIHNVAIPGNTIIPPTLIYSDLYSMYSNCQGVFNIFFSY